MYSATLQYGKWSGLFGGFTTGRSIRSAGTTTRVATRSATGLDEGVGDPAGPSVGIGRRPGTGRALAAGLGVADQGHGLGWVLVGHQPGSEQRNARRRHDGRQQAGADPAEK